ncbi:TonB-dependent siderophore receptor [Bradyrhizobium japonicum]|uniref:TonB-dependent siderophore receptor n=1 Tax=Bradyrhizobium japonicum TaxID=375 RepID=UPI00209DB92D|nr:TonB-dependent siderophore receptor [Bradyrhizobium japonicum]MCP1764546.1 iron complex outermembrane receptor protein [Bradyrhizobium japonicum]MCP1786682.1 iron complex outermembrane receptor protein [Bradyrhizobium japonicum]MCP1808560.1 iron complex outermembrane receptor protein [Bradyrhizobium japonicum]MCP1817487.1 iron complex outermembrane receptor protein [Bradyrhizobium japonicum]MCP1870999.1 iron complex outermembrane receptor protein [Bradyrhizobium japonicum]
MTTYLRTTAGLIGGALPLLAGLMDAMPAEAQSSSQELPAVVVEQSSRPAARTRPSRSRQAAQAASRRRQAERAPSNADTRAAGASTGAETATGPVRGYVATRSGTGTKTDTPLRETPQSISVVTADRIIDQGATTVQEALRYVPGVFADAYGADSRGDYPRIRGQDPNIYLDGTRMANTNNFNELRPEPYTLERIEVLRGPSSVLYGDTSTAGLLNLISKRPQVESANEIGVQYGSFNRKQVQLDSTGKLTKDGEWLYRFIGVFRDSNTQTDYVKDDRIVLAPSLTWRPTNNTSWTVLGTYQKDTTGSSTAFLPHEGTLFAGPNGYIPVQRFAGEPGFDKYQTETGAISSLFEHSFSDTLKIRQNLRYAHVEGIYRSTWPDLNFVDPSDPNYPFLDPSRRTVARSVWSRETVKDNLTSDSNAELKLHTGPVAHKVLFGTDYREFREHAQSGFTTDPTPFDLYAPVYRGVPAPTMSPEPDLRQTQLGLYAQDQLRLGPWLAVLGLRHDYVTSDTQGSPVENYQATTGRAALMYELPFGVTPYVTYAQSFNPVFGSGVCATVCAPQRGEMVELGFKYNPTPGNAINGAIFDTTERNRLASDPNDDRFSIQTGKVRIRGAELEVLARVTPELDLIGAYTYLDARVESGDNSGKRVETVPDHQASLWAKYRLSLLGLPEVTLGGGVRYIGTSWDGTDTLRTPDYTLFDAMVRYETGSWRLQVNASNLFDKRHVTTCLARGDCFLGIGRTVLGSVTYKF